MAVNKFNKPKLVTKNEDLSTGITKADPNLGLFSRFEQSSDNGLVHRIHFATNTLAKDIAADAAEAFGQKLFTLPAGLWMPLYSSLSVAALCPTGLSSTAGEIGLGTTIASGAVAVLGGTAGFEDVMEGKTIANMVAATAITHEEASVPPLSYIAGAGVEQGVIDGTAGTSAVHFNIASTWNQTAAEDVALTVSGNIVLLYLGSDYGVA